MRRRTVLIAFAVVALVSAAGVGVWTQRDRLLPASAPATKHDDHDHGHDHDGPKSVVLSEEAVRGLGLRSEPVRVGEYPTVIEVPGVLIDAPGCERAVSAPAAGVVSKVYVLAHEAVKPGAPLFTLQLASEFVQTTQTELARTARDLVAATARRDQTAKLVAAGTKPGIELTEEENTVRRLASQAEGHRRQLKLFGLNAEQVKRAEAGDFVTELTVFAPPATDTAHNGHTHPAPEGFAFEVESLAVSQGQGVTAGQLLAKLADHYELLVEGQAFETEAGLVVDATGSGRAVGIDFLDPVARGPSAGTKLTIRSVGRADPAARTFSFYAALPNAGDTYERGGRAYFSWRYRPGQQVRVRIPTGVIPNVIVLPADAVVRDGPDAYVFRQNGDAYERKPVTIVAEDRLSVAVAPGNGVESGVFVLRNNAAAVNRAFQAMQARPTAGGRKGHWHADGTFHEEGD
jgi:multidrug efflux pump subunit AcrA (membrane-fusion protein)